jgi:quercetin dioxygenase-like cupin family protein
MKISKIEEYHRGWYIGNFEPSCFNTDKFEVGILTHKKGEIWPAHYHKLATEINLLLEGEMILNDVKLKTGDIFIIEPNQVAVPIFITDCKLVVVKTPSVPTDKYII